MHYTRTQYAEPLVESRYLYDPLGRRVAKRVWRRERDLTGWMSLSRKPQVTWYGWDGVPADHDTERQEPHPDDLSAGELHTTHQS
ncbi:rhsC in rhs element domain protein [Escherichia coli DEC13C]|nr:rhsC in rhs element domain protein [Escherichia coli DEC13C]